MRHLVPVLGLAFVAIGCADQTPVSPPESPESPALHAGPPPEAAAPGLVRVMTRNLYLGGDIGPIVGSPDPIAAAIEVWNQIQLTEYPARSAALADEIARYRPDLIGLQEVVTFTVGDLVPDAPFPSQVLLDFLPVLQQQLAARGLDYVVAVRQPNARAAFPIPVGGVPSLVGYEDSGAILVRADIEIANASGTTFAASPPPEFTAGIPFLRGWTQVDAKVGGGWVRFVNTHLEIQSFAPVQEAQAAELVAALEDSPWPVILVGDFNSAANPSAPADRKTGSYGQILAAGFLDTWAREGDPDGGLTCCHDPDLANVTSEVFDQRLDLVFVRNRHPGQAPDQLPDQASGHAGSGGFAGASFARVVGADDADRFTGSLGQPLWPSDHAGVATTLIFPRGGPAGP